MHIENRMCVLTNELMCKTIMPCLAEWRENDGKGEK